MKKITNSLQSLSDKHYNITYPSLSLSLSNPRFLSFSALCPQVFATARLCVAACTSVCMVGLLSIHQAFATTIPLDSITLGAVIQINGQNFVKIGDNRYLSVCGIESNKCPVRGQEYDDTLGRCICKYASGVMQNWTGCNTLTAWTATQTQASSDNTICLLDNRDGKIYEVRKLPDNRCWMTTNLAYGASDKFGRDVCANRETMTNASSNETAIKNTFGGQSNSTTTYGLWGDCRGTKNVADANRDGYYYNWAAAMQQTNTWFGSSNAPTYQTNVQGLCPAGWVLPTGGTATDSDFHKLATAVNGSHAASYNDDKTKTFFQNSSYGWHGLYSGSTHGTGGLNDQDSLARYWSSTYRNSCNAYYLYYNSSGVYPENSTNQNNGFSVRCLRN